MATKSSNPDEVRSALAELLGRGEEVVNVFVEELTGRTSLRDELEKTMRRATRAKETVDKNMEIVLGALNLPTRRDYKRLVEEVHSLQGALVNLNMKVDRLLAAQAAVAKPAAANGAGKTRRRAKRSAAKKRPTRKRA